MSSAARLQQVPENETARNLRANQPRVRVRFDFGARGFHQPAVLHAGRARRLAAAAGQAQLDVLDVGIA